MRTYCLISIVLGIFALLIVSCSSEDSNDGHSHFGGPIVYFPDSALEAAVRGHIGKPDSPICLHDIDTITVFWSEAFNSLDPGIADLTGIEYMTSLVELNLYMNYRINDLSPLAELKQLKKLILGCCDRPGEFESLEPLSHLPKLAELSICARQISEISELADLAQLEVIDLGYNEITDISPLSSLVNLRKLVMDKNQISDLTPVAGLHELTYLRAGFNQISNISPLSGLKNLRKLDLGANDRLCPRSADQSAGDKPPLPSSNLDDGEYANLVEDISPLAGLTNLEGLILNSNFITDLSPLENLTELEYIWLTSNSINDIGPLVRLENLEDVWLGFNQITTILPLVENPGIDNGDWVILWEEPLDSVSIHVYIPELEARGVHISF